MNHPHLMNTIDLRNGQFEGGEGSVVFGEGYDRDYVDFFAEAGAISLGYGHAQQKNALGRALEDDIPLHLPQFRRHPERDKAARRLCNRTGADRVLFANSGSEAVSVAIEIARRHKAAKTTGELTNDTFTIWAHEGDRDDLLYSFGAFGEVRSFERASQINGDFAGILIAPVYCHQDVIQHEDEFLGELGGLAKKHDAALIFDESEIGAGRCGSWSYGSLRGIRSDIRILANGLAMGFPASAVLANGEFAEVLRPGSRPMTFGGSVLRSVFVNEMIDYLSAARLKKIEQMGEYLRRELKKRGFTNVRGVGLMVAFDVDIDRIGFATRCEAKGVLIPSFREGPGPVKITPPLSITKAEIDRGLSALFEAHHEIKYQLELPFEDGEEEQ